LLELGEEVVLASFAAEFKHRMMVYQAKLAAAAVIFSLH
jgi:hypothetical protein